MSSYSSSSASQKTSSYKEGSQISVAVKPKPVEEDKIVSGFQAFSFCLLCYLCSPIRVATDRLLITTTMHDGFVKARASSLTMPFAPISQEESVSRLEEIAENSSVA